jgi:hypothetical protein
MVASSGTAPGTLLSGIRSESSVSMFAVRSDGSLVCTTCSGLVVLDPELRQIGHASPPSIHRLAIAPDDAMYGLEGESERDHAQLVALSPAGQVRWTAPIALAEGAGGLVAGVEGPYVVEAVRASGGSAVTGLAIERFDPATGERHTVASNQALLGAAHGGGVFTRESPDAHSATLHRLDAAGTPVWSRTLASTRINDSLDLRGAVATPDGGAVVFGVSQGTIDFGDRTLIPDGMGYFVAGLDSAGATRWAFSPLFRVGYLAVSGNDQILLATEPNDWNFRFADPALAVATPAGISRTLNFTGPGLQQAEGLAVTPDGLVWLQILNSPDPDLGGPSTMHVGDLTFTDPGTYLFKIVP